MRLPMLGKSFILNQWRCKMTISYENFSSFEEVETLYNNVIPMGGKNKKSMNIKPLATRSRSWEQIVKISKNCYVLEYRYGYDNLEKKYKEKEYSLLSAPIVWRKLRDGTETVTISNGIGNYAHNGHYSFLERFLPLGLSFRIEYGKQFIVMSSAKNHEPPHDLTPIKEEYYLAKRDAKVRHLHYQVGKEDVLKLRDDGARLTFKRITGKPRYEFVDGGKPIPKAPRKIVNKNLKAKYKKNIEDFYGYVCAMKPILKCTHRYKGENGEYGWRECNESKNEVTREMGWYDEKIREIIKDPNHKFKLNLVVQFLNKAQDITEPKRFRATYNRWINEELGFIKEKR
jgi:hypothetical protein